MSRTTADTWAVQVNKRGTGPVALRIAVRGTEVEFYVGGNGARPIVLPAIALAELVEDLRAAGRTIHGVQIAQDLAREYRPRDGFGPMLSPEELDAALDGHGQQS